MPNINELKQTKAQRKAAAEALVNSAIASGRDLQGAELEQYNGHIAEIQNIESLLARHASLAEIAVEGGNETVVRPNATGEVDMRATPEYAKALNLYLRKGDTTLLNTLGITTPATAGYATTKEFDTHIVERLQANNVMRSLASVITTEGDRNITVENNLGAAGWTTEGTASTNDNGSDDNSFGQVTLSAYKLTRIIKVSEELLQDAFFDVQGYLARKFGAAFGIAEEAAFVANTTNGRPTGVVGSASASGVTTASPTAITSDELLATYHGLKRQYRDSATWMFADSTALMIRKLKDSTGQYLWQPGLQAGQPDRLLNKPVAISDAMPAVAATATPVLFGDFSYYTIADRGARTFTRLNERYADLGLVGFRGVERTDGKLTLAEAVVSLLMHA